MEQCNLLARDAGVSMNKDVTLFQTKDPFPSATPARDVQPNAEWPGLIHLSFRFET